MADADGRWAPPGTVQRIATAPRGFDLRLALPGSKSIALRQVLMSALAAEPTRLAGMPNSDDLATMLRCVVRLGATVEEDGDEALVSPAPAFAGVAAPLELDVGMSGVSLRLLLAAAALRPATTRFVGHAQLHRRPNADLLAALERIGCKVVSNGGRLPIAIDGPQRPRNGTRLRTKTSSQFLSALLLAAPRLPQGLAIELEDERTSASYIGLTVAEMAKRGVEVRTVDADTVAVSPSAYAGGRVVVEGDASAATYFAALATLHGGCARFTNLGEHTRQGDYGFLAVCERAGAVVERNMQETVVRGPQRLEAVGDVDMADMPDAAPTLMAMAPFLPAPTRLGGLATLRIKECDRIKAGAAELRKAGVNAEEFEAAMTIHPAPALRPANFETYEDHRMAMALSVLASKVGGCTVLGADCVAKTYADYWRDFGRIYRRSP